MIIEQELETSEVVAPQPATIDQDIRSLETLRLVCEAVDESKADKVVVLDVRGQTIIADFFVICSGTSTTHIHSIADNVQDKLREIARLRAKPEGGVESLWIIMDYGDVILHVFDEGTREFYDLERLWADARIFPWPEADKPAQ